MQKYFQGIRAGSKRGQSIRSNAAEVDPEIIDQLTEKLADQLAVKLAPVGTDYDEDDEIAAFKRVSFRYQMLPCNCCHFRENQSVDSKYLSLKPL